MEQDESPDPSDAAHFGPQTIMPLGYFLPHLIEKARFEAFRRERFTDKSSTE
jgi:hypothetical protein